MKANRLVFNELRNNLNQPDIVILLGARQVGKTFILRELENELCQKGKKVAYFNLEIPSDIVKFTGSEEDIFNLITNSGEFFLLDEFHYLKNASHLFKAVYDSGSKVKIIASGSSSLAIHKHLKESMAGRRKLIKVYPLSLKEYKENDISLERLLVEGTLPGLLNLESDLDRQNYLRDLIETYILKDIKSLVKEENVRAFNHLLYLLAENQGSVVSVASLAKEIGLTARTIEKYLFVLEQTYVCFQLPSYSRNTANELKKSRKYYLYDLGIRNALIKNFEYDVECRKDKGVLLESIVFLELMHQVLPNTSLYFWRTKQKEEVDFVKVVNRGPVPIEVKSRLSKPEVPGGMRAFIRRYPETKRGYVVSNSAYDDVKLGDAHISFIKWTDVDLISKI